MLVAARLDQVEIWFMQTRPAAPRFVRRSVSAFALFAFCAAPLGCQSIQQRRVFTSELSLPTQNERLSLELSELWNEWWPEITAQGSQTSAAPGPSLVAGDWLAWQCAHAGGYFENQQGSFALGSE